MNKITVIGGGAAGLMAAIAAAKNGAQVSLIEPNERLGKKINITGKGRCNVTNDTDLEGLMAHIPRNGRFLYSALSHFTSRDTMAFFEGCGVPLKVERGDRVFPVSDSAFDITDALKRQVKTLGVRWLHDRAASVETADGRVTAVTGEKGTYPAGGYDVIREFQRRWGEIGFVPIKQKDAVQKKYKAAVDALFNTLRGSERDRSMNRFREKVSTLKSAGSNRLRSERERLYNKVRQLEQEIGLLENNIGFFAKSKNAEALVADVKAKIDRAREEMAAAIEKVKLIDRQAQEENQEHNENK